MGWRRKLALFNSAGYLEIAINKGNVAGLFGLKGFSERSGKVVSPPYRKGIFWINYEIFRYFKVYIEKQGITAVNHELNIPILLTLKKGKSTRYEFQKN